jgi:hypothetical protein
LLFAAKACWSAESGTARDKKLKDQQREIVTRGIFVVVVEQLIYFGVDARFFYLRASVIDHSQSRFLFIQQLLLLISNFFLLISAALDSRLNIECWTSRK